MPQCETVEHSQKQIKKFKVLRKLRKNKGRLY